MIIALDFLMILFLTCITVSITGLLWSFLKERSMRKWTIRLALTLLLFITTATIQNNYLLSQEKTESASRYVEQERRAMVPNEKNRQLENSILQQVNRIEENTTNKINPQDIRATESSIKNDMAIINAKIDYLLKYISSFIK